jgi:dTMP kinase
MTRGKFITLEGGEGAGKSTQAKLLAARLIADGLAAVVTREPGGSAFAEQVRSFLLSADTAAHTPLSEALMFSAARADHLETLIRPALASGQWVICDRFTDSTRAYQGAAGGLSADVLRTLEHVVVGTDRPQLTIVLDLDAKVGLSRANQRRGAQTPGAFLAVDSYEGRTVAFHQRLRQGFLDIAAAEPNRVVVVQALQNQLLIADQIWDHVRERLLVGIGNS